MTKHRATRSALLAIAAGASAGLVLTACGGNDSETDDTTTTTPTTEETTPMESPVAPMPEQSPAPEQEPGQPPALPGEGDPNVEVPAPTAPEVPQEPAVPQP